MEDSFIAVAAGSNSTDTVWFVKVIDNDCLSDGSCIDDYGNAVGQGVRYLKGHFLEKIDEKDNHKLHKLSKKQTFFYNEIVNPKKSNIIVRVIYRHPSMDLTDFNCNS